MPHVKPFLLVATRPEDDLADAEYEQFCRRAGLEERELRRLRLEQAPMPDLDLAELSGIVIGGSPFTTTDPQEIKSDLQVRVEADLARLLDRVIAQDVPLLGACYGVGTLGVHQGGVIDRTYAESAGAIEVTLTDAGRADPVARAGDLPPSFTAFVGHKEAMRALPPGAVLLASGEACPIQMFRVGERQYATQFHPELDAPGLSDRLRAYRDKGYVDPEALEPLLAAIATVDVDAVAGVLRGFVEVFAR
ncbi:glutamine amidotransferase [Brachybacterium huguangmaarense]